MEETAEPKKPNKRSKAAAKKLKSESMEEESPAVPSVPVIVQQKSVDETKEKANKKKKTKKSKQAEKQTNDETNVQIQQKEKIVIDLASKIDQTKENKEKKNKADKKKGSGGSNKSSETKTSVGAGNCTLVSEIAKARQHIKDSLERMDGIAALASTPGTELLDRLSAVEKENLVLRQTISKFENLVVDLTKRVAKLEGGPAAPAAAAAAKPAPKPAPVAAAPAAKDDDDDGVDLFASDDDDEDDASAKVREERLAAYAAKKSKKPALIAKSNIIFDVKGWGDETDMDQLQAHVRSITCDGLLWGAAKLVPVGYGIHKLQIASVVEDDKVSVDWLQEQIEANEDLVQSVDIAAFNKI